MSNHNPPAIAETLAPVTQAAEHINAGAVAIEQERAIAEARGQIQLAKMFPRSVSQAIEEFMEACKSPEFAEEAFYSVPNRGSGPSIRFAEEAARCYGNFEYGHRELSRGDGKSEIEVYAWDKEKNNYSRRQITVAHIRDTRQGPKVLRDQADIDNRIANVASKQMRGRILALMPKSLVAMGVAECQRTLAGDNQQSIRGRINKMISAFSGYGVTTKHLSDYLGHDLDTATADDITDLIGVYNALKQGAKVADYFSAPKLADSTTAAEQEQKPANDNGDDKDKAAPEAKKPAKTSTRRKPKSKPKVDEEADPKEAPPAAAEPKEQAEAPAKEEPEKEEESEPQPEKETPPAAQDEGADDDFDDMFDDD